ncbi:MAG: rhomboid family intramembrane serine protease [Burkholderiaceae bacterium]
MIPLRRSMLIFVAYSLFMGFTVSFIDNSAHIGGLVSGFILATLLAERFDWDAFRRTAWWRALLTVALSLAAAGIAWQMLPAVTR